MVEQNVPENSIRHTLTVDPDNGELRMSTEGNLPDSLDPDYAKALIDISQGINAMLENGLEYLAFIGGVISTVEELMADEDEIGFDAADELLEAIKDRNVIPFDKKKMN